MNKRQDKKNFRNMLKRLKNKNLFSNSKICFVGIDSGIKSGDETKYTYLGDNINIPIVYSEEL